MNAQDLSSTENLSSNPSLQTSGLPETVVVYMMYLDDNGFSLGRYCYQGDGEETGCVEEESGLTYPPSDPSITYAKCLFWTMRASILRARKVCWNLTLSNDGRQFR